VRALTGVDTDRLAEEHRRGISIELGYAQFELPSGRRLSIVDVPGHQRLIRTMVAGATGFDAFLLTIAADDGPMPQTLEHLAILRALQIRAGLVAVTKSDAANPAAAIRAARELLPDSAVVAVSARTGAGLAELRTALEQLVRSLPGRAASRGATRLHVDRVFTIRGAGTVATGTLWQGALGRGDELVILPGGRRARVRGVEVHSGPVERALAGQRVAVNLTGVDRDEMTRGDLLADPHSPVEASYLIDAALEFDAEPPHSGTRVQIHHGTRHAPGRLAALGGRFWQLRLEQALLPLGGDRLVVRQIAPAETLGGGTVLVARARKHGPSSDATARLTRLLRGEPEPEPKPEPAAPRRIAQPPPLSDGALELERLLRAAWLEPPLASSLGAQELAALRAAGRAVRAGRDLYFHADAVAEAVKVVERVIEREGAITLGRLRDELRTSRKFAQALLDHCDAERVTLRQPDDSRTLRRR
jgi:selenocysteine-specific elongation factor